MREKAPWPDFAGNPVHEGDRLIRPCGESGVVRLREQDDGAGRWWVDYGHGQLRPLQTELGVTGRATVLDETGLAF